MTGVKSYIALVILGLLLAACGNNPAPTMQSNTAPAGAANPAPSKPSDEKAAVDAIAKVNEAQATYFKLNRRYALTYEELIDGHLLNSEPAAAQTGYEFKLRPAADAQSYKLSAAPAGPAADARHFFTDQTGVVRAETGKDATADSPKI